MDQKKAKAKPPQASLRSELDAAASRLLGVLISPTTLTIVVRTFALASVLVIALLTAIIASNHFYRTFIPARSLVKHVSLQYGFSQPPFALIEVDQFLATGQPYDVTFDLILAPRESVYDIGNFMVTLDLLTTSNETTLHVSQPASIPYTPKLLRNVQMLTSPRLILGWARPELKVSVTLVSKQVLQTSSKGPINRALLQVGRNDHYGPEGSRFDPQRYELQIYSSTLHFDAQFSGLRYFMYYYRITSFVVFTSAFFVTELVSALLIWAILIYRKQQKTPNPTFKITPSTSDTDRKPTKEDLLRQIEAADRVEAAEQQRRRMAATSRGSLPRMLDASNDTVLAALKEDDDVEEINDDSFSDSDEVVPDWSHAPTTIKEEDEEA